MEFPDLGQHCSHSQCNKLDFLPMKCDACSGIFCSDHISYDPHNCSSAYKKNVQVPVCPLCNKPVPVKRGELPDRTVGEHIDRDCLSDPAKAKRIYNNRCKVANCKQRELVPIVCSSCRLNFCIKHRHTNDHNCQGFQGSSQAINNFGFAAWFRSLSNQPNAKGAQKPQPSVMDEDEALARALQESLNPTPAAPKQRATVQGNQAQETEDEALAKALQQSEEEYLRSQQRGTRNEKQCVLA